MAGIDASFADYCCELLQGLGPCIAKRMFGGWGISVEGLTVAILADLGGGDTLWLKANEETAPRFLAAGCERFSYGSKTGTRGINYYSAPPDAMESPALMLPWGRLALEAALQARKPVPAKKAATKKTTAKKTTPAKRPRGR
ncbi:TfoX/Sxy family protein [uncultured Rhodoferax sp.]|uniref:TfoX/Sxy family protein n=1 Tax=uncultured Rhodoferax sp. TaxID=223188 RepID=UPI0025F3404B|nr:TfoX/Sxy family protein [uncultured Rhodoferax sp.]